MARFITLFVILSVYNYVNPWFLENDHFPFEMCPVKKCNPSIEMKPYDLQIALNTLRSKTRDSIITVMTKIGIKQRQELRQMFKEEFNKDISDVINLRGFSLRNNFGKAYEVLMQPPENTFADHLHFSILHSKIDDIVEILFTVNNLGVVATVSAYGQFYGNIVQAIEHHIKEPILRDLFVKRVSHNRLEALESYSKEIATEQARTIMQHSDGNWEMIFNGFLVAESMEQLLTLFDVVEAHSGLSMVSFIEKNAKPTVRQSYLDIVHLIKDPYKYLAKKLYKMLHTKGTDDKELMRIIIGRSEIDLLDIEDTYNQLPEVRQRKGLLRLDIEKDTGSQFYYQTLLTRLLAERMTL